MMKKIVTLSLFIFTSGLAGILIAGFLVSQQKCNVQGSAAGVPSVNGVSTNASTSEITLSASEVAKHNKASDCWQVIDNKVYDFTKYLNQHPGGADIVIAYCGQEASSAFSTKGGQGRNHSDFARRLLTNYLVGGFNQKIRVAEAGSTQNQATIGNNPSSAGSVAKPAAPAPSTKSATPANGGSGVTLTAAEAAKHSTAASCWLIVSGKIYDVSGYLSKHPAGAGAITPYCGQEATSAFSGSGGGHAHSDFAWGLLGGFYIGTVGQQAPVSTIQQNTQQAQAAAQQAPANPDEDD